jgi:hypothetical protein
MTCQVLRPTRLSRYISAARSLQAVCRQFTQAQRFSTVPSIVPLYSKCTRTLTGRQFVHACTCRREACRQRHAFARVLDACCVFLFLVLGIYPCHQALPVGSNIRHSFSPQPLQPLRGFRYPGVSLSSPTSFFMCRYWTVKDTSQDMY